MQHKEVVRRVAVYRFWKQKLNISANNISGRQKVQLIMSFLLVCHFSGLNGLYARAVAWDHSYPKIAFHAMQCCIITDLEVLHKNRCADG